jgi:Raf kinase inhibitor-like YbhB/YbcL family protein
MKAIERGLLSAIVVLSCSALASGQAPPAGRQGGGRGGPRGPVLSVTTSAWPDGGEVPMKYSVRGDNKSPAFDFHWSMGTNPADAPADLKTYVVSLRDMENSTNKGPTDSLHWAAFNIPGTTKGLPEGLAAGTLPDGTVNGPGFGAGRGGNPSAYFGPGAGPGPIHHYCFEFFALDTKLDLPATVSREDLLKAMEGHVIGKAAYFGRFHSPPAQ